MSNKNVFFNVFVGISTAILFFVLLFTVLGKGLGNIRASCIIILGPIIWVCSLLLIARLYKVSTSKRKDIALNNEAEKYKNSPFVQQQAEKLSRYIIPDINGFSYDCSVKRVEHNWSLALTSQTFGYKWYKDGQLSWNFTIGEGRYEPIEDPDKRDALLRAIAARIIELVFESTRNGDIVRRNHFDITTGDEWSVSTENHISINYVEDNPLYEPPRTI